MPYQEPEYQDPNPQYANNPLFPKLGLQLACPRCAHEVPAEDINIDKLIAKCGNCNNVFAFEEEMKTPLRRRQEIFMPEEIELDEYADELTIFYKWRKAKGLHPGLVFFGVFWNLCLVPFLVIAVVSGNWFMLLGLSIHLSIGFGFLVHIITRLLNSTYITVNDHELAIEHRPFNIPYFHKNQYFDVRDIDQLYAKKYSTGSTNGQKTYEFGVFAKLVGGTDLKIIGGLKHQNKALFIEQEIEFFLGIKDKPVSGEVS